METSNHLWLCACRLVMGKNDMMRIGLLLGSVVIVTTLTLACGGSDSPTASTKQAHRPSETPEEQPQIETMLVTESPAMPNLILAARIAYGEDRYSKISSPIQGVVVKVLAKLGQSVRAGEVLMTIDSPDIAAAYSGYVKEISELSLAKRNYELAEELLAIKAIPLKDFKQTENDYNREKAEFRLAKEKLLNLRVPAEELEKPLDQQHIVSRFELKCPLVGTVVERNVTPGQLIGGDPTQILFTVADLDTLQVVADVYERDLRLVKIGQAATATVEAAPGEVFPATIAAIGDIVDPTTRTVKLRAWVNNGARKLKPEMFAQLNIPIEGAVRFIVIPTGAVVEAEGKVFVYVEADPGQYARREVQVEKIGRDEVRVLSGLTVGEHIVAKRTVLLKARERTS